MADGLLGNSKNTLLFAGGIIACAAIAALTLGSQFTPKADSDYLENRAVESEEAPSGPIGQATPDTTAALTGFADDSELMDDTNGLDTTPAADGDVIVSSGPQQDDTNGFSDAAFNPVAESGPVGPKAPVFGDYAPAKPSTKRRPEVKRSGPVKWEPKVNPLPPDPPKGQPFPKDRKIIKLEQPGGG